MLPPYLPDDVSSALLDAAPDAMLLIDNEGRIALANAESARTFGYPRETLRGMALEALLPERYRGSHSTHLVRFFAKPQPRPMGSGLLLVALRQNGEEFPVEVSLSAVPVQGMTLAMATVRDLSDKAERIQAQLDLAPVCLVRVDRHGIITHVNETWRAFARENGGDAKLVAGQGLDYLATCRASSEPSARAAAEGLQDIWAGRRKGFQFVYPCHSPSLLRWFLLLAWKVDDGRGATVLMHVDVSAQHLAEERLNVQTAMAEGLAKGMPVPDVAYELLRMTCEGFLWEFGTIWQPDGDVLRALRTWPEGDSAFGDATRATQLTPGDDTSGMAWREQRAQWATELAGESGSSRATAARAAGFNSGLAFPISSGGDVFLVLEFFTSRTRQPELAVLEMLQSAAGQLGDAWRRARAEAQTRAMEAEVQTAHRLASVGSLAAGLAHEINTPVQFVSDSVHFLQDAMGDMARLIGAYQQLRQQVVAGQPAMEAARAAGEAEQAADLDYVLVQIPKALTRSLDGLDRVAAIVRSMKAFARPPQAQMAAVDLNEAIQNGLSVATSEYSAVADLKSDFAQLPDVTCDPTDISQVTLELVINAAHAIADVTRGTNRRGTITVGTRRQGDDVLITVADTGGGIPGPVRPRVFDPFFTTKGVGEGKGQGLSVAWSLVKDKHHGDIWFETSSAGTTFHIRLPIGGQPSELTSRPT